ncbi:IS110 family RNA-guided transposase [Flavisolibacter nicotianae]|uniref:IS110 family transposase n=1 Tax=Flavisolibacter nicotianae TaxID=2364882 RepID=UPI000EAC7631|nr:IS110 family transposase [Flavisolibacter nicotianae]
MKQLFIGLDVHKKSWAVTIQEGQLVLKRFSMEADAGLLIAYVSKHYPKHEVECCYEACCLGFGIYHELTKVGWQVVVVNPADIPRGNKQSTTKTDKVDSAYLAKQLAAGHLKAIYVPTHKQEQFRSLFRRRNDLVKNLRRIKCHIKSMLLYFGTSIPLQYDNINWSKDFIQWLHKQHWSYTPATETLKSRLSEYQFLRKEYLHICNELRAYARKQYRKEYYLLRSIPGVGPFIAIGLLAEVGDIRRFRGIDKLSSYIGLVPSVRSSGEKSYTCGITYRSKGLLRSYLIEAAWIAAKKDPVLMQYYQERKGADHKKLIIKLAAKTLSRIYHVIKTGEPYQLTPQPATV